MEEDRRSCMTRATTRGGMGFEDLCRGGLQASYVIDTQCLANVTAEDSLEQAQRKLVCKIDELFKAICLQRDATIKQFYVGKTFVQIAKRSKSLNQMEPKTWRKGGISSRWGTHKKEEYGKDGMLVIGVITKSQVPTQRDSNKPVVDQEQYTLALEQRLIQHYRITRKDTRIHNATFTCGGADKKGSAGYALYVAFSLEELPEGQSPTDGVMPNWDNYQENQDSEDKEREQGCSNKAVEWVSGLQPDTSALSDAIDHSNTTKEHQLHGTHHVMYDSGVSLDHGEAEINLPTSNIDNHNSDMPLAAQQHQQDDCQNNQLQEQPPLSFPPAPLPSISSPIVPPPSGTPAAVPLIIPLVGPLATAVSNTLSTHNAAQLSSDKVTNLQSQPAHTDNAELTHSTVPQLPSTVYTMPYSAALPTSDHEHLLTTRSSSPLTPPDSQGNNIDNSTADQHPLETTIEPRSNTRRHTSRLNHTANDNRNTDNDVIYLRTELNSGTPSKKRRRSLDESNDTPTPVLSKRRLLSLSRRKAKRKNSSVANLKRV